MRCPRDWATVEIWHRMMVKDYSYGNKAQMESLGETCALVTPGASTAGAMGTVNWSGAGVELRQAVMVMVKEMPAAADEGDPEDLFFMVVSPKTHPYYLEPLQSTGCRISGVSTKARDFHRTYLTRWGSEVSKEVRVVGMTLEAKP